MDNASKSNHSIVMLPPVGLQANACSVEVVSIISNTPIAADTPIPNIRPVSCGCVTMVFALLVTVAAAFVLRSNRYIYAQIQTVFIKQILLLNYAKYQMLLFS